MKILYVEDEIAHVELTERTLEDNLQVSFVLLRAESFRDALKIIETEADIDLVLTDLRLPDGSGLDLLKSVQELPAPPAVVLVTGQGDQEVAVAALKAGAADYLVKQSDYLHRLPVVLTNAIAQNRLLREQAALREAQARFRALVEQIPAAVYTDEANELTSRIYISPQIEIISGYKAEEWLKDPQLWKKLIHPEDLHRFLEDDERTNRTGEPFDLEYRLMARNGQSVWIHDMATLVRGENGKPLYWQGVLFDITKQKESQTVIRESEERFRRIFHSSPIATCVVSVEEGRFLDANSEFLNLTGSSLENLVGHTSIELGFWHQQYTREVFVKNLKEKGTLKQVEVRYVNVPNGPKDTLAYYELIELAGNPSILAMFYDVTEQKKTQEAIRASESSYRGLFNSISQAIYIQDKAGRFLDVNDGAVSMYGYPREFFIGKTPDALSAPGRNDLKELAERIEKAFLGEAQEFEFWGIRSNGEVFPKDVSLNKGTYFGQDVVIAIGQDITLRKRAEDVLEYQVKELSVLHSAASAGVQSSSEDEIIERITKITSQIYPDVCGILLLNQEGTILTPHRSYTGADATNWHEGYPITEGITGKAVSMGRILRIGDVSKEAGYIETAPNIRSELCVPIHVNDRIIGILNVESKSVNAFNEDDERLLNTIAGGLGTAIEKVRLFEAEKIRREDAEKLREVTASLGGSLELEPLLESIMDSLARIVPFDSTSIFLDTGQDEMEIVAARGFPFPEKIIGRRFSKTAKWHQLALSGQPLIIPDVRIDPRFEKWEYSEHIRGWMGIPMIAHDKIIGFINLDRQAVNAFIEKDATIAQTFANSAAIAIENARLFQEEIRRTRIIETLADIANEIATTRDIIPIFDKITQRALDLLGANHVAIYLLHDDNKTIKVISAQGNHREELLTHSLKIGEGITGNIVATGKPEVINDIAGDPRGKLVPGTPESDARDEILMSSPLILRGKPIGAINAWRLRSNGLFNKSELNFLISIAHQVSVAIESSSLFQETIRRAHEAYAIAEVGRDISATLQIDLVLERIAKYAKDLLNAESSAVYLPEPATNSLRAIAAIGVDAEEIKSDPLQIGIGILGNIAIQKSGEIVNDTVSDPRTITIKGTELNPLEHIMGVPVLSKDHLAGLVVVWRTGQDNEFKLSELDFLSGLAQQAAVAIENARLYDETQRRLSELETINRVSSALRNTQSINEMLDILLDQTLSLLHINHGSVWIYDSLNNELVQKTARGFPATFKHIRLKPSEGIVGHVFLTGNIHVSAELISDPLLYKGNIDSTPPGLGGACIPIQSSSGPVGVLMVEVEKEHQITDRLDLLATLAEITANAIHRAELFEHSREQVRKLTTLRDIDSAIASSTDLRVTLNILMDHTLKHLKVDAVDIMLYHPELQSLTYLCSAGFYNPSPSRPLMRIGEGLAGQVVMKGRIEQIPDLQITSEVKRDPMLLREGFVAYIGVPLIVKGQIKGVFEVFQRSAHSPTSEWMQFMQTLAGQAAIAIDNSQLFDNLQRSNQEITQAYDTTLEGWARALELRDRETEGHTRRVTELTMRLAQYMNIGEDELVNIYRGVLLHDIGKMGVPDQILRKTGPLTEPEWAEMRQHPQYAFNLLAPIPYLRPALDIPYCHHEHWDGSGYPRGLKGEQIPLSARIFSIVDIWDALLSDRSYRKAWPREKVINYVKDISGEILDPNVVVAFLKMMTEEE